MCQGGNSRSVALAYLLKYKYGVDALACSWEKNSEATRRMLFGWADKIFIMQAHFLEHVPAEFRTKTQVIDVGPDVWFNGLDPELVALCDELLNSKAKEHLTASMISREAMQVLEGKVKL